MRKLLVVTAILAFIVLLYGCGGSSSHHQTVKAQSAAEVIEENEYEASHPSFTNIAAFWNRRKGQAPQVEVFTLNRGSWINNSATDILTTNAKGVRLERAPDVGIYRLRAWYSEENESHPWDGEGLLPLTKSITSPISGKQHKHSLVKIKAYLYSEQVGQGEAVPMRTYCSGCDNRPRRDDPPHSNPYSG